MSKNLPRVVALLATYNEERFIQGCLENLIRQHVNIFLIDNGSTDQTISIAQRYLNRGLIGIETFPRNGIYSWKPILERKEHLANTLDADWFIHIDADEVRLSPWAGVPLAEAFAQVEEHGFNAVNFQEFTFIPTRESPDHDNMNYERTMRSYYPFLSSSVPNQVKAWKRPDAEAIELAWSGGHQVRFSKLKIFPQWFPMRHYLFLSVPHAVRKYIEKRYDLSEVEAGWHRARAQLRSEHIRLPTENELRAYISDNHLDGSNPRARHYLFDSEWAEQYFQN